jgi:hypothetical protein
MTDIVGPQSLVTGAAAAGAAAGAATATCRQASTTTRQNRQDRRTCSCRYTGPHMLHCKLESLED